MSMVSSKGLTVQACITVGVEEGIIPHPQADMEEERRLLYVAMTRARKYAYATWARRRKGPTARAGKARVQQHRDVTGFLAHGPVQSQDGDAYMNGRWGQGAKAAG